MKTRLATWPDPTILNTAKTLKWYAKSVVDDVQWGLHRSKRLALGMEFDQYRRYTPGDDLRLLDWKKYARTGKYYLRQSVQENTQTSVVRIDDSPSMDYIEEGVSKLDFAKVLAAGLLHVAARQGDRFSYCSNGHKVALDRGMVHWQRSVDALYTLASSTEVDSNQRPSNHNVIWITDLYNTAEYIQDVIKTHTARNSSLLVVRLVGQKEETLDFKGNLAFIDLETKTRVTLSPKLYAERYKESLDKHNYEVTQLCYRYGAQIQKVYLQDEPQEALRNILNNYR